MGLTMEDEVPRARAPIMARLLPSPLYTIRGALFIWNHTVLWKYAAAPLLVGTVILGIAYILIYYSVTGLVGSYADGAWYLKVLYYIVSVIVTVLLLVIVFFVFARVASAIAAPFNELISEKTEELVTGTFDETPFSFFGLIKDSGRSVVHSFKILGIYVALLGGGLPMILVPGVGGLLYAVFGALLSSYMFAYEYLGYPMDRRRLSFSEKRRFLRRHFSKAMGFGLGNLAVASIPGINLLFIPAAVVGGTLLFLDVGSAGARSERLRKGL
ncbi:MAG: EI24 domain-containing protein [Desulfomonilaceae bacterium]|nr:EI24 domain-containing protein [Desulfomonilaceae bacterium]